MGAADRVMADDVDARLRKVEIALAAMGAIHEELQWVRRLVIGGFIGAIIVVIVDEMVIRWLSACS